METIFDYDITEEEKEKIGRSNISINDYLKCADRNLMIWDLAFCSIRVVIWRRQSLMQTSYHH